MEIIRIVLKVFAVLFFAYYGIMLIASHEKKNTHDELYYRIWIILITLLWH